MLTKGGKTGILILIAEKRRSMLESSAKRGYGWCKYPSTSGRNTSWS